MSVVEELEEVITVDPAPPFEGSSCTQQLLDNLLGRFEEEDLPMFLALGLKPEIYTDSDD